MSVNSNQTMCEHGSILEHGSCCFCERDALRDVVYQLVNEFATIRDMLDPIVKGEIERGHSLAGLLQGVLNPGLRKTKLLDAKRIAVKAQSAINRATSHEKLTPIISK